MTWVYLCDMDGEKLSAETEAQLVEKVMWHANREHGLRMSHEQAEASVKEKARELV